MIMKILKTLQILQKYSDENHPMTVNMIINMLAKQDISAERKGIYRDIKKMMMAGYSTEKCSNNQGFYYQHELEYADAKIICDTINASNFISMRHSRKLIDEIMKNLSIYEQEAIDQSLCYIANKVDTTKLTYTLTKIQDAINLHQQIAFYYFDHKFNNEIVYRKNNQDNNIYQRIPKALVLVNDKYYLIAYATNYQSYGIFRADKIQIIDEKSVKTDFILPALDTSKFINENFNMNIGIKENIEIRFDNDVEHIVYDRLLDEAIRTYKDDKYFIINFDAKISSDLISWIMSFKNKAKVLKPKSLINDIIATNKEVLEIYEQDRSSSANN